MNAPFTRGFRPTGRVSRRFEGGRATTACVLLVVGCCLLGASGCLGRRLTAAEVVRHSQAALEELGACRSVLELEIDTDLLKESVSLEVWEQRPGSIKVSVLSAVSPQLQGMAFATDGEKSMSYMPHTNQVLVGPADRVKMPLVLERVLKGRTDWMRHADPEAAAIVAKRRESGLVIYEVQVPLVAGGFARYAVDARQWWPRQITYEDECAGHGELRVLEMSCYPELTADQFSLDIPGDVPVTEIPGEENRPLTMDEAQVAVPFPLLTPGYLPEGTQFAGAYRLDSNVAMVYTGDKPFTLVQGPGIGPVPQAQATPIALRGYQALAVPDAESDGWALTWREDGLQFSVAGSLEQSEIIRIAESLRQADADAEGDPGSGTAAGQGR